MKYNEIGKTGMYVSNLSFGASSLGGVFHEADEARSMEAVFAAVENGINFIDVSPYYGHYKAETVLGKALKEIAIKESVSIRAIQYSLKIALINLKKFLKKAS